VKKVKKKDEKSTCKEHVWRQPNPVTTASLKFEKKASYPSYLI